jgi:protein-S-isoprenylcysteine O-methyltransferase Ste14
MRKLLSAAVFFLMSLPVLAATEGMNKADAPPETVSMVYVVIFGVIFIGAIIGFFIYLFMSDKKEKSDK